MYEIHCTDHLINHLIHCTCSFLEKKWLNLVVVSLNMEYTVYILTDKCDNNSRGKKETCSTLKCSR